MTTPGGSDEQGWGRQDPGADPYGQPYGQQPQHGQPQYGQPQYGQPTYGSVAPMPGGHVPPPPPRPSEVVTAFWLWVANIVVGLVAVVVTFFTLDDTVTNQVRDRLSANPDLRTVDAETFVRAFLIAGAVFTLIFAGLKLFFLFKMRAGRNWARVTLTVFGGLSIVSTLISLGGARALEAGLGLLQAVLIVAAIVFMFTGSARAYFAPRPKY